MLLISPWWVCWTSQISISCQGLYPRCIDVKSKRNNLFHLVLFDFGVNCIFIGKLNFILEPTPTKQHPHPHPPPRNPPEPPPWTHQSTHKPTHIDTVLNPATHSRTTLTHQSTPTTPQHIDADEPNQRRLFNHTITHSPPMQTNLATHRRWSAAWDC